MGKALRILRQCFQGSSWRLSFIIEDSLDAGRNKVEVATTLSVLSGLLRSLRPLCLLDLAERKAQDWEPQEWTQTLLPFGWVAWGLT